MIERERQLSKIYYISKCFGKLTVECFKIELSNPFGEQNKKKNRNRWYENEIFNRWNKKEVRNICITNFKEEVNFFGERMYTRVDEENLQA